MKLKNNEAARPVPIGIIILSISFVGKASSTDATTAIKYDKVTFPVFMKVNNNTTEKHAIVPANVFLPQKGILR